MSKEQFGEHLNAESREKCRDEFVSITKTDDRLATSYLSETEYNLQVTLINLPITDNT